MVTENKESKPFSFKSFLEQYHVVIPWCREIMHRGVPQMMSPV